MLKFWPSLPKGFDQFLRHQTIGKGLLAPDGSLHLANRNPPFGAAESEYDFFREAAWIRRFSKKIIPSASNTRRFAL
jgi:hypothetical protein